MLGFGGRRPESALASELKRATPASGLDVPKDALLAVEQASHNGADRRVIMLHINNCLIESDSTRWRRIYAGLSLLDHLLRRGPSELVSEISDGVYFDLTQRLAILEGYEYSYDRRVEGLIRRRATSLRSAWSARQMSLAEERPKARSAANSVARAWHCDDTTDEESSSDERAVSSKSSSRQRAPPAQDDSSTTDGDAASSVSSATSPRNTSAGAVTAFSAVELLGTLDLPPKACVDWLQVAEGQGTKSDTLAAARTAVGQGMPAIDMILPEVGGHQQGMPAIDMLLPEVEGHLQAAAARPSPAAPAVLLEL